MQVSLATHQPYEVLLHLDPGVLATYLDELKRQEEQVKRRA